MGQTTSTFITDALANNISYPFLVVHQLEESAPMSSYITRLKCVEKFGGNNRQILDALIGSVS